MLLPSTTKEKLELLKLKAFIDVFKEISQSDSQSLSLAESLLLMADREILAREDRRLQRLLKVAKLRYPQACVQEIDYKQSRDFNQQQLRALTHCEWVTKAHNVIFIGPTGVGKSYFACALGHQACQHMMTVKYFRVARLVEMLRLSHADGSYQKNLEQLARIQLLILDDWGIDQLERQARRDLLEVLEDRSEKSATIITTQLPVEQWHSFIGDDTIADAICDRLVNTAYKITITGESMRKTKNLTHVDHLVTS